MNCDKKIDQKNFALFKIKELVTEINLNRFPSNVDTYCDILHCLNAEHVYFVMIALFSSLNVVIIGIIITAKILHKWETGGSSGGGGVAAFAVQPNNNYQN